MEAILGIAQALIAAAFQRDPPVRPVVINAHGDVVLRPDRFSQASNPSAAPVVTYGADGKDKPADSSAPRD